MTNAECASPSDVEVMVIEKRDCLVSSTLLKTLLNMSLTDREASPFISGWGRGCSMGEDAGVAMICLFILSCLMAACRYYVSIWEGWFGLREFVFVIQNGKWRCLGVRGWCVWCYIVWYNTVLVLWCCAVCPVVELQYSIMPYTIPGCKEVDVMRDTILCLWWLRDTSWLLWWTGW